MFLLLLTIQDFLPSLLTSRTPIQVVYSPSLHKCNTISNAFLVCKYIFVIGFDFPNLMSFLLGRNSCRFVHSSFGRRRCKWICCTRVILRMCRNQPSSMDSKRYNNFTNINKWSYFARSLCECCWIFTKRSGNRKK